MAKIIKSKQFLPYGESYVSDGKLLVQPTPGNWNMDGSDIQIVFMRNESMKTDELSMIKRVTFMFKHIMFYNSVIQNTVWLVLPENESSDNLNTLEMINIMRNNTSVRFEINKDLLRKLSKLWRDEYYKKH